MRISEGTVVQAVDGKLVIAQDGDEVALGSLEAARLFGAVGYFAPDLGVTKEQVNTEYDRGATARGQ